MPLETYLRGKTYWVRGRIDGIDNYQRGSLATSDPAVAAAKVREIERKARQRAILGPDAPTEKDELTFAAAVTHYPAKPREADYLIKVIPHIGAKRLKDITSGSIKSLARQIYPSAAADTWRRQVIAPVRAVINHCADLDLCAPMRVRSFTRNEVIEQDRLRGKQSRQKKTPGSWEWIDAFRQAALYPPKIPGKRQRRPNPYAAALAHFMFTTGARVTQSVIIRRTRTKALDLDLAKSQVYMPAAKGHPAQWVKITPAMMVEIANLPPRNGRLFGFKTRHSVYGVWQRICDDAGIDYLPPHSAGRHGFGTELLVRQGVDPVTTAEGGRWSSPRVPLETYGHGEQTQEKVVAAFERKPVAHPAKSQQ